MDNNIASEWEAFERMILDPIGAPPGQRREMRRAFYAGAAAMFMLVSAASEPPDEEVCVLGMAALFDEVDHFRVLLKTGKA